MYLNENLLKRVVEGTAFLGSGGGGKMESGFTFIREILNFTDQVEMLTFPLTEVDKKRTACIVCDMGSITAFDPKQDEALCFAFESLSGHFCKELGKIDAVFPIETGPENTMAPFLLAAKYKIPVIDGDGAGRAVPVLMLSTFAAGQVKNWRPIAISNGLGDSMLVSASDLSKVESVLRETTHTSLFSNSSSLALWPDEVGRIADKCVQGSISMALHCGQLLRGIRIKDGSLIAGALAHVNQLEGFLIGKGKVIYKTSDEKGAFNFTTTKIEQADGTIITIMSQNESLIAFQSNLNYPIAIAPDSICYLKSDFNPCTNAEIGIPAEDLQTEELYLIGVKANDKLLTEKILAGFKTIINELGFAGNTDIPHTNSRPLGDLFLDLAEAAALS